MPPKLPGMYFDEEKGRYFAIPKSMCTNLENTEVGRLIKAKVNQSKPVVKSSIEIRANKSRTKFKNEVEKLTESIDVEIKNVDSFRDCNPTLLNLLCLMNDENRKASAANTNTFSIRDSVCFKRISKLEWEITAQQRTNNNIKGYYCVSKDLNHGLIYPILLGNDSATSSYMVKQPYWFNENDSTFHLDNHNDERLSGIDELIAIGVNTQDELIDHNKLKRWLSKNQYRRLPNNSWSFGTKTFDCCKSEMTFLFTDYDFVYMGFRDGTVVIQYTRCVDNYFLFNIGTAVCSVRPIVVDGFLVCIVSGISHVLRSYKFDHITFEWIPFIEYSGYNNVANLSQNIKAFKNVDGQPNGVNGIFIIESQNNTLMDKELLFYDFTRSKPLKCTEFRLLNNKYTFTSWFLAGNKLLLFNGRQQEILAHQILQTS